LLSLDDYPGVPDTIEDGNSFLENALKKARAVAEHTGESSLADDSGLEVDILEGKPGVYSSRYSGPDANDENNIDKLLMDLKGVSLERRQAAFRCVLVIYDSGGHYESFEGILRGFIALERKGSQGFGYDPVFFVPEFNMTIAEMPLEFKNRISHRGHAFKALRSYLKTHEFMKPNYIGA
jgi:XTP/dITP diphosphohydrolase